MFKRKEVRFQRVGKKKQGQSKEAVTITPLAEKILT
jgi:hypothetical protein